MKTVYTILFFLDTLALVLLTYLFLKLSDQRTGEFTAMALFGGIIVCILLMVFITIRFIKLPGSNRHY
ncbi:MAG TPA: hypothetical protein VM012_10400 [Flavitalea sp.]|nr:hypothetical protein [Flavitalea sp.]